MEPDPEASAPDPEEQRPRASGLSREEELGHSASERRSDDRRRDTSDEDLIPELPDDLFSWSGRERRSRGSSENSSGDEHPSDVRGDEEEPDSEREERY